MATLYLAVFPSAASAPTWNLANIATNAGFSGSPVYTDTDTSPTVSGDHVFSPDVSGLTAGTPYKTYVVWDDGTDTRPESGPLASAEWTTLTVTESITVNQIANYRVFEGAAGSRSVTISGTHGGSTDTIQVQIETTAGGVVSAWQTLQSSVAPGAYSGSITVPRGGWYYARVRKAASTGTTALQTQKWGVGFIVGGFGQSHVANWLTANNGLSTDDRAVSHDGSSWATIPAATDGALALAASLIAAADCPVAVIAHGVPGAPLSYFWASGAKQSSYTTWEARVTAAGGALSGFFVWQGEGDLGRTKAAYKADLDAMFAQLRTDYGAPLPITVLALGRLTIATSNDADYAAIRGAHIDAGNDAGNYLISTHDFALSDGLHFMPASSVAAGDRMAQCIKHEYGLAAYSRGPVVASASISGTTVDVLLNHDGGTDFTPSTGITGFDVLVDGSPVTISSAVRQTANTVRISLAATPSGAVTLRFGYGRDFSIAGLVKDNTAITLPIEYTDGAIAVAQLKRIILDCIQRVGGAPATNITGLEFSFFDESSLSTLNAPVVRGTLESTDGSGALEIDVIGTALNVGDTGYIVVGNSARIGFHGPVPVSG